MLDYAFRPRAFNAYARWLSKALAIRAAFPNALPGSIPAQDIRGALGCAREALHRARFRVRP